MAAGRTSAAVAALFLGWSAGGTSAGEAPVALSRVVVALTADITGDSLADRAVLVERDGFADLHLFRGVTGGARFAPAGLARGIG